MVLGIQYRPHKPRFSKPPNKPFFTEKTTRNFTICYNVYMSGLVFFLSQPKDYMLNFQVASYGGVCKLAMLTHIKTYLLT